MFQGNLPYLSAAVEIGQEAIETIERNFQAVRPSFTNTNGELRFMWCSLNLAERALTVGLAEMYRRV